MRFAPPPFPAPRSTRRAHELKFVLGVVIGIILTTAAGAVAASQTHATPTKLFTLHNGDDVVTSDGEFTCIYANGTTSYGTIDCGSTSHPRGYTVAINRFIVSVSDGDRFVYKHACC